MEKQLTPADEGPTFGASTTESRFATEIFLTAVDVGSDVTVVCRDRGPLDFCTLFTITLSIATSTYMCMYF